MHGLSTVVTDRANRRRGLARRLVVAARHAAAAAGADLALFSCEPPLVAFYAGAGFPALPGTVLIGGTPRTPLHGDRLGKVVVGAFFAPRARAAADAFAGVPVALHPGEIDWMW